MRAQAPYRYLIAILCAIAGVAVRLVFLRALGSSAAYITVYPAVMLAALYGGFPAGLLTTAVAAPLASYFWIEPIGHLFISSMADRLSMALFLFNALLISWIVERMHRAQARARRLETEARLAGDQALAAAALQTTERALALERLRALLPVNWAFGAAMALLLAAGGFCYHSIRALQSAEREETTARLTRLELVTLLSAAQDAETGQRGYLITGEPNYLEPYHASISRLSQSVAELRTLLKDEPAQQVRLQGLEVPVTAKLAELDRTIGLRRARGFEAARREVLTHLGKSYMDDIRRRVAEMLEEEGRQVQLRAQARGGRFHLVLAGVVGGGFLAAAMLTLVFLVLREEVAERAQLELEMSKYRDQLEEAVAKRTEALRGSEERYHSMFSTMLEGFCIIEVLFDGEQRPVDYRFLEINPAFEAQTGLRDARGKRMRELAPEHEAHWFEIYGKVALTGEPARFMNEAKALGRYYDVSAYRVGGPDSRKVAILFNDITERKRAVEVLRLTEAKFAEAFSSNPAAIAMTTLDDGTFLDVNDTWVELMGYGREEVTGRRAAAFPIWPAPEARERFVAELRQNRSLRWQEQEFIDKSGRTLVAQLSARLLTLGGRPIVLSTLVDITGRKQAEAQLRDSEQRFRTMVDAIPQLAWTAKPDGWIYWYNRRWYEYTGTTPEQMEGWGWQRVHDPAALPAVLERWKASIASGEAFDMTFPLLGADGVFRPFLTRVMPLKDDAGRVLQWFGTNTDISEQKRMEDEVRRANVELESSVAARTAQLQAANQELESFSYSVSHDLRAPLRAMDGFSQALLEDYSERLDEQGKDYLSRVRAGAQRMGQLIDGLLDLSRLGRAELQHQAVDLGALARSAAAELRRAEPGRKVELIVEEGLHAEGDAALLRAVIDNLLANAWKFTSKRPEARVEFGARLVDGQKAFFVKDNGAGFDPEHVGKLFGAFQRLHTISEFPGSGIGLATVRRIINRHGGRIWAEGAVDQGATFYFTLPANNLEDS